jgi:hypothetical protein
MTFFLCLIRPRNDDNAKHTSFRRTELNEKEIYLLFLGVFLFLPIAVNLFLIQHKESKRYLCGENNQLFGLVSDEKI